MAKEHTLSLKTGDLAPEFLATSTDGSLLSLSGFKGHPIVLFFYPKDNTPRCTREACEFRDIYEEFKAAGVVVLGVSTDPIKSHAKFTAKFELPFPLLSDVDQSIVRAYGVWGEKIFMGRKYMGTYRVTFHIGPDSRIVRIWPTVKPEGHAAEVLASLRE
ncbi:MAG: thioredoxin-dependent thiol peroxidase [Pedosphaera sp.]|nr:thioredoxin-dependent thiol peroxidase [Pedosphaera sp.]